jgi:hypothetical protein
MVKLLQRTVLDGKHTETELGTFADEKAAEEHVRELHAALAAKGQRPPWPRHRIVVA